MDIPIPRDVHFFCLFIINIQFFIFLIIIFEMEVQHGFKAENNL